MVISKSRCHAGPFKVTFTSNKPISFGTSAKINDGYNTSTTFNSIIDYSKTENSMPFRVGKTTEQGDYFIFNSPHPFMVSYSIVIDFVDLTSATTTLNIPAYGYERLFTSNLVHKSTNSLTLTNVGKIASYDMKIAYTFSRSETPNFQSLTFSSSKTIDLTIPSNYYYSSNIPFYIYLYCGSSQDCNMELYITEVNTNQQNTETETVLPPTAEGSMESVFMDELLEGIPAFAYGVGSIALAIVVLSILCCLACFVRRQKKKAARVACVDASTETSFRFVTTIGDNDHQPTLAFVPSHSFNKSSETTHTQVELPSAAVLSLDQPLEYPNDMANPNEMMPPPPPYTASLEEQPVVMYQTVNIYQDPKSSFNVDPNFKV